jgi:hypothetical protein
VPVAPAGVVTVKPAAIRQAHHPDAVTAAADLAATLGAAEPDLPAQLRPVDGIEPASDSRIGIPNACRTSAEQCKGMFVGARRTTGTKAGRLSAQSRR